MPQDKDSLQRFLFDAAPVRGEIVRLDQTWREVLIRRHYPAPLQKLMGELLAAASLLSAMLKRQKIKIKGLCAKKSLGVISKIYLPLNLSSGK